MAQKSSPILTLEQRLTLTSISEDLAEGELRRYYTLTPEDQVFINRQHGAHNRLGMALQLCVLRYPGRPLADLPALPEKVIQYVADQLGVAAEAYIKYGQRESTIHEHLERLRENYGYRTYSWSDMLTLTRHLLPLAMESEAGVSLVEAALSWLRGHRVMAPGITTTESLVWRVQRMARWRVYRRLTQSLTPAQVTLLDDLLETEKGGAGKSRLGWFRLPPGHPSSQGMYHLLERLAYVQDLPLPPLPPHVHPNRLRLLVNRCRRYKAQTLAQLTDTHERYALLVAYLTDLSADLTDQILDMFDRWLGDLLRKGRNAQKHHLYSHVSQLNQLVNTYTAALAALLEARALGLDPLEAMFAVVDEATLAATVKAAQATMRPADLDYRDLLENRYSLRRKALLQMYRSLTFEAVDAEGARPTLEALDYVVRLQDEFEQRVVAVKQTVQKQIMTAPLAHLKRTRWKRHALEAGETINPNYYEMEAWQRLKERLRTGDMAVQASRRYREFDSYLLPQAKWQALKDSQQTRLAVTDQAKTYLQERQHRIQDLLTQLPLTLNQETFLTLDEAGLMHLKRAEKSTPEEAKAWSQKLYAHCPLVELADVLIEVAASTGCLAPFVHLVTGQAPTARQTETLIAALMGIGMNLGLSKMAQATDFTPDQLETMADWFIREETLQQAQIILDNFVLHQPYSRFWGQGTTSSSDGLRLPVPVKAANALYNARYFGFKRGITIVTHAADIWMPFSTTVADDAREALHVIDALCHHETDFDLQEHYTDTGGSTYHVFALTMMLGFRFAPRLRSIVEQYLYTVEPMMVDAAVQHLIKGQVDGALITQNWDEMRRLAASIRHGTVSAALIMRKLAAYPKQNRLAQAFNEMGKLERTIHVLSYLQDPMLLHLLI